MGIVDKVALCGKQSLDRGWRVGKGNTVCLHNVARSNLAKKDSRDQALTSVSLR